MSSDAILPETWLTERRFAQLTDRAWRAWTGLLMFSAAQGTDGRVRREELQFISRHAADEDVLHELVNAELITVTDTDVQARNWPALGQVPASHVERAREQARTRQRRHRARKQVPVTRDTTITTTTNQQRHTPREGEAR